MLKRFFSFLLVPIVFAACTTNNVTVDDEIQKYFDSAGVKGSFGFYDNGQGHFTIYNLTRFRDSFYAPGGSFDILQGLVALQTGVVTNDTSALGGAAFSGNLPGGTSPGGTTLSGASSSGATLSGISTGGISLSNIFRSGGNDTVSLALANAIGKDTIKKWVDSLAYGNKDIKDLNAGILGGKLKIPADQQMGLIKKLYFGQLPFFQRNQDLVRKMFLREQNSNYSITYKTGKTIHDGRVNAWIMGWDEENKHPYFFVCNMESADVQMDPGKIGLQLVKNILGPMGFFAGKK
jgi:beta-lactamase class D